MIQTPEILKSTKLPRQSLRLATALAALLTLAACASTPQAPTQSLQAAEQAINTAEQTRAEGYAALELSQARDKLAAAKTAVQKKNMILAKRLADESLVDAELATARAGEIKAKKINDAMKESTETLKQEMDRNTGIQR